MPLALVPLVPAGGGSNLTMLAQGVKLAAGLALSSLMVLLRNSASPPSHRTACCGLTGSLFRRAMANAQVAGSRLTAPDTARLGH